ncbi:ATP-grasp domain-containing protein [Leptothoe spongobia]|uniref:ATP-grasp domain-containing protein n=1 Tax=Leptothoe spongobia TAU-MAC 1115 TaxID=1967444 RepID=A0A947DAV0_9CYAN|nr:hypothetical protein [Leptothoe spongobia]MBT9313958.1 hypothetical protein [Leptothoe spongobia TAU-MAC 1115]
MLPNKKPLLIAGGTSDPNLTRLAKTAENMGVSVCDIRQNQQESPAFSWRIADSTPTVNNQTIKPSGAFIRYDVFQGDSRPEVSQRATGWYQTIYGWLLSQPDIHLFNRDQLPAVGNKPAMLMLAHQLGLSIPWTCITNEESRLREIDAGGAIAKPVAGGDYCYPLEQLMHSVEFHTGCTATPAIVQNKLVAPEVRIYIVGNYAFAFEVRSNSLDYRIKQDAELLLLDTVPPEVGALRALMTALKMNFGAADFKTDPKTKKLIFLELNSSPMFARFDQVANGALCEAMVRELVNG